MTRSENKPSIAAVKELMGTNRDALREIVQDLLQELLEGEMTEALGASKSERSDGRIGYRSGYLTRSAEEILAAVERFCQKADYALCHERKIRASAQREDAA